MLDTHIWFKHQTLPHLLKPAIVDAIDQAAERNEVFVSVISIWEFAMLERDGKLELDGGVDRWCREALAKPGIALLPLSPQIAIDSVYLKEPMHKDPADRILVASARVERLTLVTRDRAILNCAEAIGLICLPA
ncbi:type II toxin-antitoxin system VapC family toxin [Granulicella rosea]|uniref:type II toxin-antitoxin system VapC family toxin n=1 Tax=Granulicella rosea TaxID=474952 RepID=UPI0015952811|nr:type II toxin-antitoxin system VapC family toxin [Granulicella rosea]